MPSGKKKSLKNDGPKVHNKYHNTAPADAVYIGRPSKWGNPFSHLPSTIALYKVSSREEAISKFRECLDEEDIQLIKKELKGKHLVCFCAPKACHGDVLLEIANGD